MSTAKKKKHSRRTTAVIAVVVALAIIFSGTLAWQSISQKAKNEVKTTINPGGRLHDDFSGPGGTKDIYVENFGTQDIYARVRLDEYMELGKGAGTNDPDKEAQSLVYGAEYDDETTWTTHIPGGSSSTIGDGMEGNWANWVNKNETFHKYWSWTMGGETTYMPTFNLDNESLTADINGTMAGGDSGEAYGDFVDYTLEENASKTATASYSNEDGGVTTVEETHTVQKTLNAQVITMAEYNSLSDPLAFEGWVYDSDGWAYWSQPIAPGTATGLLLDKLDYATKTSATGKDVSVLPQQDSYYAINAVAQFVTYENIGSAEDGNGFYSEGGAPPSSDALALLSRIGVDIGAVTLSKVTTSDETETLTDITNKVQTMTDEAAGTSFTAKAAFSSPMDDATWKWTSSDSSIVTVTADSSDSSRATVKVADNNNKLGTITITANYTTPSGAVLASASFVANVTKDLKVGETVRLDGINYTVMAVTDSIQGQSATESTKSNHKAALLLCDSVVLGSSYGTTNSWEKSAVRSFLNGEKGFPISHPEAVANALTVTISTYDPTDTEDYKSETTDTFFVLSESDVTGKATSGSVGNANPESWEYTAGSQLPTLKALGNRSYIYHTWLRTPDRSGSNYSLYVQNATTGTVKRVTSTTNNVSGGIFIRPAFWYNLGAVSSN